MCNLRQITFWCALSLIAAPVAIADQGKIKACAICHGMDGYSDNPNHFPHLYGKSSAQIAKALKEYRAGKRHNKMMEKATRNLSDEDIDYLSDYYGNIK